jgi:hypothetical protein
MPTIVPCEMEIRDGEYFCKTHDVRLIEPHPSRAAELRLPHMHPFVCPVSKLELETFPNFSG